MTSRRRFGFLAASAAAVAMLPAANSPLDAIAQKYVRLVLALGIHDPDYVDAFYGPAAWRDEVQKAKPALGSSGPKRWHSRQSWRRRLPHRHRKNWRICGIVT